jgi:hypothetical protein
MATKREYLITLGLAKEGRGKFSNDALAALAKAVAEGVVFDEPVKAVTPKAPKPAATEGEKPAKVAVIQSAPLPQVEPKEVRAWAKANGHEVGEKGRLNHTVVRAFLDAGGKPVGPKAAAPKPAPAAVVRPERTGWTFWRRGKGEQSF